MFCLGFTTSTCLLNIVLALKGPVVIEPDGGRWGLTDIPSSTLSDVSLPPDYLGTRYVGVHCSPMAWVEV